MTMALQEPKTRVQRAHFLLLPQNFCFDLRVQRTFKDITLFVSVLRNCVEVISSLQANCSHYWKLFDFFSKRQPSFFIIIHGSVAKSTRYFNLWFKHCIIAGGSGRQRTDHSNDMAKQLSQNAILHLPRWYRDNRLFHRLNYPASLYSLYVW